MPKESASQKKTISRVMHEYKHGELESGNSSKKVKSRKQAVAIALSEAGASKNKSRAENKRSQTRTKSKERAGKTAMPQKEGTRRAAPKSTSRTKSTTSRTKKSR